MPLLGYICVEKIYEILILQQANCGSIDFFALIRSKMNDGAEVSNM